MVVFKVQCKFSYFRHQNSGYTLIELLVTVAILGIVIALAAPALGRFVENQKVRTATNTITALMSQARTEAVSRATIVVVEWNPTDTAINRTVNSVPIVLPPNTITAYDTAVDVAGAAVNPEPLINQLTYLPSGLQIVDNLPAGASPLISFNASGRIVGGANLQFTLSGTNAGGESTRIGLATSGAINVRQCTKVKTCS